MIDWSATYSIEWRLYRVDRRTWANAELIGGIKSASINRNTGDCMESGTFEVSKNVGDQFVTGYYRLAALVSQETEHEQVDIATLHCLSTGGAVNHGHDDLKIVGRSVLHPAWAKRFDRGECVPAGSDAVDWAASRLSKLLACEVSADGSFSLDTGYAFDLGGKVLDGIWKVLESGGWCIQINGRGDVSVRKKPSNPSLLLDERGASLLMPEVQHDFDLSGIPNRYVAVDGSIMAEAVNDDPASPTSTASVGFDYDADFDTSPIRVNGESLQAYADRRLMEESTVFDYRGYTREYDPYTLPYSVVRGSLSSVKLEGDLRVLKQSISCGARIVVTEQAAREMVMWQR